MTYAFGHSPTAAERLDLLDAVFAPTTDAFLDRAAPSNPGDVLDLGCGPGAMTLRLVERFPTARVVGVDLSPEFVEIARGRLTGRATVEVSDVTSDDLAPGPFGLVATRFLVTHLVDPAAVVARWVGRLRTGGVLLVEETASIATDDPVLVAYLELAGTVLSARGHDMFAGRQLGRMAAGAGAARAEVVEAPLVPTVGDAATLFVMNLATLRHDPTVAEGWSAADVDSLRAGLLERCDRPDRGPIEWTVGQLAVTR